jgi:hypothetical protein
MSQDTKAIDKKDVGDKPITTPITSIRQRFFEYTFTLDEQRRFLSSDNFDRLILDYDSRVNPTEPSTPNLIDIGDRIDLDSDQDDQIENENQSIGGNIIWDYLASEPQQNPQPTELQEIGRVTEINETKHKTTPKNQDETKHKTPQEIILESSLIITKVGSYVKSVHNSIDLMTTDIQNQHNHDPVIRRFRELCLTNILSCMPQVYIYSTEYMVTEYSKKIHDYLKLYRSMCYTDEIGTGFFNICHQVPTMRRIIAYELFYTLIFGQLNHYRSVVGGNANSAKATIFAELNIERRVHDLPPEHMGELMPLLDGFVKRIDEIFDYAFDAMLEKCIEKRTFV